MGPLWVVLCGLGRPSLTARNFLVNIWLHFGRLLEVKTTLGDTNGDVKTKKSPKANYRFHWGILIRNRDVRCGLERSGEVIERSLGSCPVLPVKTGRPGRKRPEAHDRRWGGVDPPNKDGSSPGSKMGGADPPRRPKSTFWSSWPSFCSKSFFRWFFESMCWSIWVLK